MRGQLILLFATFLAVQGLIVAVAWWRLTPVLMARHFTPPRRTPTPLPESLAGRVEDVAIPSAGATLRAWLVRPDCEPVGIAVLAHGWGQEAGRMGRIAEALAERAVASLVLDLRGQGRSEPAGAYNLVLLLEDLRATRDWLSCRPGLALYPAAIVGFSFGGLGGALSAARDRRWRAAVVIGSPSNSLRAITFHLAHRSRLPARLLVASMVPFLRRQTGADPHRLDVTIELPRVDCPVLVVHGKRDPVVPYTEAERAAAAVPPSLRTVRLVEGGGHGDLLFRNEVVEEVAHFVSSAFRQPLAATGSRE